MLQLHGLSLRRDGQFSLAIDRLDVAAGERITLLGPSGSGKSTLIRLIADLESPASGRVRISERDVTEQPPHRRQLSLLAQDFGLWPHLTAIEHVAFARSSGDSLRSTPHDLELLDLVRLVHKKDALPTCLSGGERQRLALARALARRPRLLLLDEPFSNVDPVLAGELEALLEEIHQPWGLTRIQVRHWMRGRPSASERYLVMEAGRLVQDGTWQSLMTHPTREWTRRYVTLDA